MMKKAFIVGAVGSGKTTLKNQLIDLESIVHKFDPVEVYNHLIDSPGEFLENRRMYAALNVTANNSDIVILLQSVTDTFSVFPNGFTKMFTKPVVGIASKIDLSKTDSDIERAHDFLHNAGVSDIFDISSIDLTVETNQLTEFANFLNDDLILNIVNE